MPAGCWKVAGWVAVLQAKLFGRKAAEAFQKSTFHLRCRSTSRQGGHTLGHALCAGGLTPAWSEHLLNDLVPEGTCTASRGSLSETTDWLDIEVRRWDTKVVPRPAFLIQLGPDKTAAGKTTNQIRWQFSTVSNYCCSKGGPDKINQTWEWFTHSWFIFFFFSFFSLSSFWRHSLTYECEHREQSWSPSPSLEQNTRVDLWAGLLGNGNSLLFMMFCRKVQYPPVRAAGLQRGFYKRCARRGGWWVRQLL